MGNVPNIILYNPYRVLGVFANSPKREIVANKGKATAFLKVNRPVDYPLDLKGILPPLTRTLDSMNEAEAHLAIAKEQIKYAQFWFLKMTPLDEIAFNHLFAGNAERAIDIWTKQETFSSLQNKLVCYIIENKLEFAIKEAEKLNEKFGNAYINKIDTNCTIQMNGIDLLYQFIDTLGAEVGYQKLISNGINERTKKYIHSQTTTPLINKIISEVERSKSIDHDDAKARIESARTLVRNTKESFATLKSLMEASDPQFQIIADKLGLEILQCGIDYFNNSDDEDKHQTAMKMQKYASKIVVGTLAKQRCEENLKILQRIIDELPPQDVRVYDRFIQEKLSHFSFEIIDRKKSSIEKINWMMTFLKICGPYIGSIKEYTGNRNPYYLRISTQIIRLVLNYTIEIINLNLELLKHLFGFIEDIRDLIKKTWLLTLMMDKFDIDPLFKQEVYLPNRVALKNIVDQAKVYVGQPEPIDMRSEKQMFLDIKTISDCSNYIKTFPNGKYKKQVLERKESIRLQACKTLSECDSLQRDYPHRRTEIEALREKIIFENCDTISKCKSYLKKYPNGKFVLQIQAKIEELIQKELNKCDSIEQCEYFIENYSDSKYVYEAEQKKQSLIRSRYWKKIFAAIAWLLSLAVIVGGIWLYAENSKRQREENEQREEQAKQKAKQAEFDMYDCIVNKGDTLLCDEFIEKYPNSEYVEKIKQVQEEYNFHHLSTFKDCMEFLSKYPSSQYKSALLSQLQEKIEIEKKRLLKESGESNLDLLRDFINNYSYSGHSGIQSAVLEVKERVKQIEEAIKEREEKLRQDSIKQVEEAKKREEYEKYGTDANAWKTAISANTIAAYQDYLKRYPRGKHAESANKAIIDLEVQTVINSGDYGHLPSSQKMSYETGRYSTIHITSRCDRSITIMYSGVKSMKIVLGSYQSRTIVLPSSTYKVVATAPGVRSFYGTENLTGGDYESEYYISTSRY